MREQLRTDLTDRFGNFLSQEFVSVWEKIEELQKEIETLKEQINDNPTKTNG